MHEPDDDDGYSYAPKEVDWNGAEQMSRAQFKVMYDDHFARGRFHALEVLAGRNPIDSGCTCRNCAPARRETWRI